MLGGGVSLSCHRLWAQEAFDAVAECRGSMTRTLTRHVCTLLLLRALSVEGNEGGRVVCFMFSTQAGRVAGCHITCCEVGRSGTWLSRHVSYRFSLRSQDSVLQDRALVPQLCGGSREGSVLVYRRSVVSETRAIPRWRISVCLMPGAAVGGLTQPVVFRCAASRTMCGWWTTVGIVPAGASLHKTAGGWLMCQEEGERGGRQRDTWRVRSVLRECCVLLWLRPMTSCLFQT